MKEKILGIFICCLAIYAWGVFGILATILLIPAIFITTILKWLRGE